MRAIIFPGQGAQFKGMGRELFSAYPRLTRVASDILGYSIEELCLEDRADKLRLTQFTQPALYVVNALGYAKLRDDEGSAFRVDILAGHSLGEFNALHAAGAFDFETGLKLVQRRGALMGAAGGGAMAAVIGRSSEQVQEMLTEHGLNDIDLANFNTPAQVVIAGPTQSVNRAHQMFEQRSIRSVILNVSAAFHSRYMQGAQQEFTAYMRQHSYGNLNIPVVANVTARPYAPGQLIETLGRQIASPVQWIDTVRFLMGKKATVEEIGVNKVLTRMVNEIMSSQTPIVEVPVAAPVPSGLAAPASAPVSGPAVSTVATPPRPPVTAAAPAPAAPTVAARPEPRTAPPGGAEIHAQTLGSPLFRQRFGTRYAYASGAMYRGVASVELVIRMGQAGFIGFFGAGGLNLAQIETALRTIKSRLTAGQPFGMNLLANYANPAAERATVELYLQQGVRFIEAAAFMQITPSLVLFRAKGLRRAADGRIVGERRILAKVSRPEVAAAFMSPCPRHLVQQLLAEGKLTAEEAQLAELVPTAEDICVEADSGGHTDGGIASVMFPAMRRVRADAMERYKYGEPICMGLAGGIGAPEAAAAAFVMGADFIVTGSINQCTVDAGITDHVKNLLQEINIQDTDYAPAGDMFEMGAKVQVLKKGVFFPARANKLFSLYSNYNSLDELPEKVRQQLQTSFFKRTFVDIWSDTREYLQRVGLSGEIAKAEANPKAKMALVFRWYFGYATDMAFSKNAEDKINCQIHTGPALGAFNQWVKGTTLEPWTARHADEIGEKLMVETARHLSSQFAAMRHTAVQAELA